MAKFIDSIKGFFSKKTLSMTNHAKQTEWSIRISMGALTASLLAFCAILFVIILFLMAYTPILNIFPNYKTAAERHHDELVRNIMRIDSLEQNMELMQQYSDNVSMVMVGRTPVVRSQLTDTLQPDKTLVKPSQADSLLRQQMEGDGEYALAHLQSQKERAGELFEAPVVGGKIVRHFSQKGDFQGVALQVAPNSPVTSVGEGTVVGILQAEDGYTTVIIQHYNDFVSIYRNLVQVLVSQGQSIRTRQVLGYNAMPQVGDDDNPLFELELWNDGKAVDPEIYMVF